VSLETQILPYFLIHFVFLVILVCWMNANLALNFQITLLIAPNDNFARRTFMLLNYGFLIFFVTVAVSEMLQQFQYLGISHKNISNFNYFLLNSFVLICTLLTVFYIFLLSYVHSCHPPCYRHESAGYMKMLTFFITTCEALQITHYKNPDIIFYHSCVQWLTLRFNFPQRYSVRLLLYLKN
jgi:hypothetical protein